MEGGCGGFWERQVGWEFCGKKGSGGPYKKVEEFTGGLWVQIIGQKGYPIDEWGGGASDNRERHE